MPNPLGRSSKRCSIEGCTERYYGHGYCFFHYEKPSVEKAITLPKVQWLETRLPFWDDKPGATLPTPEQWLHMWAQITPYDIPDDGAQIESLE